LGTLWIPVFWYAHLAYLWKWGRMATFCHSQRW
jgi:hypothetical protein